MSISPATLALAIPAASKAANAAINVVGQAVSFPGLFAQREAAVVEPTSHEPSIREQLDSLSKNLRQWLSDQGIHTPYEIRLGSINSDPKSGLSVQGMQGDKIRNLLAENPERLSALKRMASSIQALSSSLGSGRSGLSITESESTIIY